MIPSELQPLVVTCYDPEKRGLIAKQKFEDAFALDLKTSKAMMLAGPNDLFQYVLSPDTWKIVFFTMFSLFAGGYLGKAGSDFYDFTKEKLGDVFKKSPNITDKQADTVKGFLDFLGSLPEGYTVTFGLPLDKMDYQGRYPAIELKQKSAEEIMMVSQCLGFSGGDFVKEWQTALEGKEHLYSVGPWNSDCSPLIKIEDDGSLSIHIKEIDGDKEFIIRNKIED